MDEVYGHTPVLEREVCEALVPALSTERSGPRVLVDATAGLAGHAHALVMAARPDTVVLFDRDPYALELARQRLAAVTCTVHFIGAPFATMATALADLGIETVAAILADLGASSLQFDIAARGFSFRGDGPLDMRMDPTHGETAAQLLATIAVPALARLLRDHGDEPDAERIADAIVTARPTSTTRLADVVTQAMSARERRKLGRRIHPATRTFQALRIAVNDELGQLDRLLADAPDLLGVGGRLALISFHSLEDRRIKRRMRQLSSAPAMPARVPLRAEELPRPKFTVPRGYAHGICPTAAETTTNPRSRSARLRVIERSCP